MDTRHLNGCVDDDGEFYGNEEIIESIADADTPETFYPTCRYCGVQTLPDAAYESQEQANEAGTMRCNCYEAKQYQEEKERAERREKNIVRLRQRLDDLMSYCETRNVPLADTTHDLLLRCGIAVLDGEIGKATINWARLKISFALNNKDVIVIGYTYSDGGKLEV